MWFFFPPKCDIVKAERSKKKTLSAVNSNRFRRLGEDSVGGNCDREKAWLRPQTLVNCVRVTNNHRALITTVYEPPLRLVYPWCFKSNREASSLSKCVHHLYQAEAAAIAKSAVMSWNWWFPSLNARGQKPGISVVIKMPANRSWSCNKSGGSRSLQPISISNTSARGPWTRLARRHDRGVKITFMKWKSHFISWTGMRKQKRGKIYGLEKMNPQLSPQANRAAHVLTLVRSMRDRLEAKSKPSTQHHSLRLHTLASLWLSFL